MNTLIKTMSNFLYGGDDNDVYEYFMGRGDVIKAFVQNPKETLIILFENKTNFVSDYTILYKYKKQVMLKNVHLIDNWYFCFELYKLLDEDFKVEILDLLEEQLHIDEIDNINGHKMDVSDCATCFPSETSSFNKQTHIFEHLAVYMQLTKKELRKRYITPLRKTYRENRGAQMGHPLNICKKYLEGSPLTEKIENMYMNMYDENYPNADMVIILNTNKNYCLASLIAILCCENDHNCFTNKVVKGNHLIDLSKENCTNTLYDRFQSLLKTSNVNGLQSSFDIIARYSSLKMQKVPTILILNDSELDENIYFDLFEETPKIVNWNLSEYSFKRTKSECHNVTSIQGYHHSLVNYFLENGNFNTRQIKNYFISNFSNTVLV